MKKNETLLARPERVRVTLRDDAAGSTPLELPARRTVAAGLVLAACFAVFAGVAWVSVARMGRESVDSVFDLATLLFEGFWVLGWSVGVFILGALAVLFLFYRDGARVQGSRLVYVPRLGPLRILVEYDLSSIRNLRAEPAGSDKRVRIRFDYKEGRAGLGDAMPRAEADRIIALIRQAAGRAAAPAAIPEAAAQSGLAREPEAAPVVSAAPPSSAALLALVAANLIPLAGVLFLDWDVAQIAVLYWAESAVIGFYTALKIVAAAKLLAVLAVPFFVGHYGAFMAVHFLFVYALFVRGLEAAGPDPGVREALLGVFAPAWPALAALFVSHGISFFANFIGRREHVTAKVRDLMQAPYRRIIIMQVTIIFGGWIVLLLKSALPALVMLVVLKIAADVRAHRKERTKMMNEERGKTNEE